MAIKAPTPPTPPTAPVVPGTETYNDGGQTDANMPNNGKEFGVHVTISNPQQNQADSLGQQTTSRQNTENGVHEQAAPQAQEIDRGDAAQQARQDMVQQALGMKDEEVNQQVQEPTQQNNLNALWPIGGDSMSAMSFLPLLIVFVAAFITFTLRNFSKKSKDSAKLPIQTQSRDTKKSVITKAEAGNTKKKTKGSHFEMRI